MNHSRAAIRYAKALTAAASEADVLDAVYSDLMKIGDVVAENPKLLEILESPVASSRVKRAYLDEIFKDIQPLCEGLFNALEQNAKLDLLDDVINRFSALYNESKGVVIAQLKSSRPTSKSFDKKLLEKLSNSGYTKVTLEKQVTPELIGGFVLRIKDIQFDASLSSQIKRLKREFTNSL